MSEKGGLRQPLHQRSYLLRLWREDEAEPWRASLHNLTTGEHKGFGSLFDLANYLLRLEQNTGPDDP